MPLETKNRKPLTQPDSVKSEDKHILLHGTSIPRPKYITSLFQLFESVVILHEQSLRSNRNPFPIWFQYCDTHSPLPRQNRPRFLHSPRSPPRPCLPDVPEHPLSSSRLSRSTSRCDPFKPYLLETLHIGVIFDYISLQGQFNRPCKTSHEPGKRKVRRKTSLFPCKS